MTPLIFLDTETTGLCPDIHVPWEVAWTTALHTTDGRLLIHTRRQMFVQLSGKQLALANEAALIIGGFHARYDIEGPAVHSAEVIMQLMADTVNVSKLVEHEPVPHLVGAVPSFDHNMLCTNWLGWPGYGEGLWSYHLIDVEVLVAGKLGIAPPYNSSDLMVRMGVTVDEETKHTAAGDVEWALRTYAAVYDLEVIER